MWNFVPGYPCNCTTPCQDGWCATLNESFNIVEYSGNVPLTPPKYPNYGPCCWHIRTENVVPSGYTFKNNASNNIDLQYPNLFFPNPIISPQSNNIGNDTFYSIDFNSSFSSFNSLDGVFIIPEISGRLAYEYYDGTPSFRNKIPYSSGDLYLVYRSTIFCQSEHAHSDENNVFPSIPLEEQNCTVYTRIQGKTKIGEIRDGFSNVNCKSLTDVVIDNFEVLTSGTPLPNYANLDGSVPVITYKNYAPNCIDLSNLIAHISGSFDPAICSPLNYINLSITPSSHLLPINYPSGNRTSWISPYTIDFDSFFDYSARESNGLTVYGNLEQPYQTATTTINYFYIDGVTNSGNPIYDFMCDCSGINKRWYTNYFTNNDKIRCCDCNNQPCYSYFNFIFGDTWISGVLSSDNDTKIASWSNHTFRHKPPQGSGVYVLNYVSQSSIPLNRCDFSNSTLSLNINDRLITYFSGIEPNEYWGFSSYTFPLIPKKCFDNFPQVSGCFGIDPYVDYLVNIAGELWDGSIYNDNYLIDGCQGSYGSLAGFGGYTGSPGVKYINCSIRNPLFFGGSGCGFAMTISYYNLVQETQPPTYTCLPSQGTIPNNPLYAKVLSSISSSSVYCREYCGDTIYPLSICNPVGSFPVASSITLPDYYYSCTTNPSTGFKTVRRSYFKTMNVTVSIL